MQQAWRFIIWIWIKPGNSNTQTLKWSCQDVNGCQAVEESPSSNTIASWSIIDKQHKKRSLSSSKTTTARHCSYNSGVGTRTEQVDLFSHVSLHFPCRVFLFFMSVPFFSISVVSRAERPTHCPPRKPLPIVQVTVGHTRVSHSRYQSKKNNCFIYRATRGGKLFAGKRCRPGNRIWFSTCDEDASIIVRFMPRRNHLSCLIDKWINFLNECTYCYFHYWQWLAF